nr:aminotransferase class I/II-fold pyridoxal phosphate-dependent enzyme [Catenulispora pinistramenti]
MTDGVFSMDGHLAPLPAICDLADRYDALVMVDDSHAVGFLGPSGAGTPELLGVQDRVDVLTGTLGKALGGASGGYVSGHAGIIDLLRQRSRWRRRDSGFYRGSTRSCRSCSVMPGGRSASLSGCWGGFVAARQAE